MRKTTRREALGIAAALSVAPVQDAISAENPAPDYVRLVLSQAPWTTDEELKTLRSTFAAAVGPLDAGVATLLVLPVAGWPRIVPTAGELYRRLGAVAAQAGIYIAGAAPVKSEHGVAAATEGFLIGRDGGLLVRAPKITPDILTGFSDSISALAGPAAFTVARLPFGNIGILVGEDIFRPGHVRALCFNGAEIVLNPATEVADSALSARRDVMNAVAYCHMVHVAVATSTAGPSHASRTGFWDWQGIPVLPDGEGAVTTVLDIDRLRTARHEGVRHTAYASRVLPPMVRDGLYGPAFQALADAKGMPDSPSTRAGWMQEARKRIAAQAFRQTPDDQMLYVYDAVLVQTPHRVINTAPDRKTAIAQNIKDFLAIAESSASRPLSKLVMFGEFAFTAAGYRTIADALSVTLTWPGPELDLLAAFAAKHRVYVAAQQLELDPKFPGRIFNTAFLFDWNGHLVSRHRKLQCVDMMGTLPDTTPGSIYNQYVDAYGVESLWQVVDTPLGKLAPMICFENMYPEVAQIYALKGAEIYLHLTSEGWDPITETRYAWNSARRQHALESSAYFLSVNQGDDPVLRDPYHVVGETQIIDPYGKVTGMLRESRPGVLVGRVDLAAVATARHDVRTNLGIWDEPGVYVEAYNRGLGVPNNIWADVAPAEFPYRDLTVYKTVVERFDQRGVFTPSRRISPLNRSK